MCFAVSFRPKDPERADHFAPEKGLFVLTPLDCTLGFGYKLTSNQRSRIVFFCSEIIDPLVIHSHFGGQVA